MPVKTNIYRRWLVRRHQQPAVAGRQAEQDAELTFDGIDPAGTASRAAERVLDGRLSRIELLAGERFLIGSSQSGVGAAFR